MSDLLRRIKRPRRTPAADPARGFAGSENAEAPLEASPGVGGPVLAGEDPDDRRPTTLRRGRLRKRLRFLERERELLLRDLGGLVYEIHRTGTSRDREHHRALVAGKVARLAGLDAELESGLAALGEARGDTVLREPGIGGLCPRCGEIHGSDARFCAACGFPLEVTGTPGAATVQAATAGEAIVPVHGGAAGASAGATPISGATVTGPAVASPDAVPPRVPAAGNNDESPAAPGAQAHAGPPVFEDPPTRVIGRRSQETRGTDDTGALPASDPESR